MKQQLSDVLCKFGTVIGLSELEKLAQGAPLSVKSLTFAFGDSSKNSLRRS